MASSQHIRYVGLDLETTGLDPHRSEIIETAVVSIREDDGECDIYSQLTSTESPITPEITMITGITDEMVSGEPRFSEIRDEIAERIDGQCIVGHNIRFDTEFLAVHGLTRSSDVESSSVLSGCEELDTFHLAQILSPTSLSSLSLETLAVHYEIEHTDAHRAWSDAKASLLLLDHFAREISLIDDELYTIYSYILLRVGVVHPVARFFDECRPLIHSSYDRVIEIILTRRESHIMGAVISPSDISLEGSDAREIFEQVMHRLEAEQGIERRDEQRKLQDVILTALENSFGKVIEAPTGIGKTFGYLMPSISHALSTHSHVAVSTRTKALQDQVFEKDLPRVASVFASCGYPIRYALLKGRSNYASLLGLLSLLDESRYSLIDALYLLRISRVIMTDPNADIDGLYGYGADPIIVSSLSAASRETLSESNPYLDLEPIAIARKNAQESQVVVINHSLLATEIEQDIMSRLLPHISTLIVDEAHALESALTSMFTARSSLSDIHSLIQRIAPQSMYIAKKWGEAPFSLFMKQVESFVFEAEMLLSLLSDHPDLSAPSVSGAGEYGKGKIYERYVEPSVISSIYFEKKDFLLSSLGSHRDMLEEMAGEAKLPRLIRALYERVLEASDFLRRFFSSDESIVRSLAFRKDEITLSIAPLSISPLLTRYRHEVNASIFLSATLTVGDSFDYICDRLGLSDLSCERFDEIFDYAHQALLVLPSDLSAIKYANARDRAYEIFGECIRINEGRALGLFTSYDQVREASMALSRSLRDEVEVLSQGTGSRKKILESFRQDSHYRVLLGTDAFWEGIDITGEGLSLLCIFKLPFSVPTDPVFIARSKGYHDPFAQYAVPEMIIKLRQGIGRLIRSSTDTGVILLCDDRVTSTQWGARVIEALPKGLKLFSVSSAKFLELYRMKKSLHTKK